MEEKAGKHRKAGGDWSADPGNHHGLGMSTRKSPEFGCYEVGKSPSSEMIKDSLGDAKSC